MCTLSKKYVRVGGKNKVMYYSFQYIDPCTLESGINLAPWRNVAPGNLAKKKKISIAPFVPYTYNLYKVPLK